MLILFLSLLFCFGATIIAMLLPTLSFVHEICLIFNPNPFSNLPDHMKKSCPFPRDHEGQLESSNVCLASASFRVLGLDPRALPFKLGSYALCEPQWVKWVKWFLVALQPGIWKNQYQPHQNNGKMPHCQGQAPGSNCCNCCEHSSSLCWHNKSVWPLLVSPHASTTMKVQVLSLYKYKPCLYKPYWAPGADYVSTAISQAPTADLTHHNYIYEQHKQVYVLSLLLSERGRILFQGPVQQLRHYVGSILGTMPGEDGTRGWKAHRQ